MTAPYSHEFRAMASDVRIRVESPLPAAAQAGRAVTELFATVERQCTRFDERSDLMRANAAGDRWCVVGRYCFEALSEAYRAHRYTDGLFDPRVLRTLRAYGYDRSLPFGSQDLKVDTTLRDVSGNVRPPWLPEFDRQLSAVRIGPDPADLGGIGKGLTVRWATELLRGAGTAFLIEAGGDCYLGGAGPDGTGWSVGVEDPRGGDDPVAVLALRDIACATSSVKLRRWTVGTTQVHHLIDPRTAASSEAGLLSVTVLDPDPAWAEVWTKVLFLLGADGAPRVATEGGVPAVWVESDGRTGFSDAMAPYVVWRAAA